MFDQLIGLLAGRFSIIAGDGQLESPGQEVAAQGLDLVQDRFRQGGGIAAHPLGKGHGHGRLEARPGAVQHHRRFRVGAVGNAGDVAQVDRAAVLDGHHQPVQFQSVQHEARGLQFGAAVVIDQGPGGKLAFGGLQRGLDFSQAHAQGPQLAWIGFDPDHPPGAADDLHLGRGRHRAQFAGQGVPHGPQLSRGLAGPVQGQPQERHVIDGEQAHHRLHG